MLSLVPPEVLAKVVAYLDDWDSISLALLSERIAHYVASTKRKLILKPNYGSNFKSSAYLYTFATVCSKYDKLSQFDLSNCYWLDGETIADVIHLTSTSISSLAIQGTQISLRQTAHAIKKCQYLLKLSISLSKKDSSVKISAEDSEDLAEEDYGPEQFVFSECHETLKRIAFLGLHCDEVELPTVILCFCDSLKILHLDMNDGPTLSLRESIVTGRRLRKLRSFLPKFNSLSSITVRINNLFESANLFAEFAGIILTGLSDQLDILWLPNIPANQYESCVKTSLEAFQTITLPESMSQFELLKHVRSPNPSFLSQYCLKFEFLSEVSCCYDPQHFITFASAHRNLKVLQLMPTDITDGINMQERGDCLAKGLAYFQKLEKLSIGYGIPCEEGFLQSLATFSNLNELEFGLFLQNLPLLRARRLLEIAAFPQTDGSLANLPLCTNLRKLTLANIALSSYDLLVQVLKSCTRLQSLRLSNVICKKHPDEWIGTLRDGLSQAKYLEDFRYSIEDDKNFGGAVRLKALDSYTSHPLPVDSLVMALHNCRPLRRFAILSGASVTVTAAVQLNWPSLVLACFVLPQSVCTSFSINIISSNPAHVNFVGSSVAEAAQHLPKTHLNDLIQLDSKVCKMPSKFDEDGFPC